MKHTLKRMAAAALAVILTAGMITGCATSGGKGEKTSDGDKVLFTYADKDVTLKEAWIYAKMTAANYETSYSSYFGSDFWSMEMGTDEEGNPTTFEDYVKEQVITQIKRCIVLNSKAEELKCSLDDEDKADCEKYAKAFAEDEQGKAILKECGATEKDMQKIYEENALASKVQEVMVKDTDREVSDDEARKTSISRVVYATTTTGDDGQTKEMSEKEKKAVYKKAQAAYKELQAGTDIADIAEKAEYTNTDETFAAGESEEGKDFEKILKGMKDGEIVKGVQECDNGYVIAKLVAYTDKDATASNKESIIAQREQETFTKTYDEWTTDLEKDWKYDEAVNQELWAQVVLHSEESTQTAPETTEAGEEATTQAVAAETTTQAQEATTAAK